MTFGDDGTSDMSSNTPNKSATRAGVTRSAVAVISRLASVQRFVRRRYWIWPLLFAAVLAVLLYFVQDSFHRVMQEKTKAELETILNASVNAVTVWLDSQRASATSIASRPDVRKAVVELVQLAGDKPDAAALKSRPRWLAFARSWKQPNCHTDTRGSTCTTDEA